MKPLYELTATELIAGIQNRQWRAADAVQACLKRVEALEPLLHAWAHLDAEYALQEAARFDEDIAAGRFKGRLFGVPIGVKDIYNTARMPTEMGSRIWKGFKAGNDARVVFNLRYDGAVVIGKTVTSEFAVHEATETCNPWKLDHAPGTSSSGSAAAVAAGMVPMALGSQTGGSTIRPASYCGIFGFKPSFGLIARTGVLKTTDTLDTLAWFARSIDDLELFFEVMRVHGQNYPLVQQEVVRRPLAQVIKVGVFKGPQWSKAEPYAQAALQQLADQLARSTAAGVRFAIETVDLSDAAEIWESHEKIYCRALSYYFRGEERNTRSQISGVLLNMLDRGESITPEEYHRLVKRQAELTHLCQQNFAQDIWITLSAGGEAPKGLKSTDRPDSCKIWTYLGMPAVNLPLFKSPNGLPLGVQVIARKYNDYLLLDAARKIWETAGGRVEIANPARHTETVRG